jgi:hypothetical protein
MGTLDKKCLACHMALGWLHGYAAPGPAVYIRQNVPRQRWIRVGSLCRICAKKLREGEKGGEAL